MQERRQSTDCEFICDAIVNNCFYVNTWEGRGFMVILDTSYKDNLLTRTGSTELFQTSGNYGRVNAFTLNRLNASERCSVQQSVASSVKQESFLNNC